jgi:tetratricopeptide (TPR) repeat protein
MSYSLQEQIDDFYNQINIHWEKKEFEHISNVLDDAWGVLSLPKQEHHESYHICNFHIINYMELKNFDKALLWAHKIQTCALTRVNDGDREFLKATVLYALKEFPSALDLLKIANNKSDGRCFKEVDIKYKQFFDSKK